MGRVFGLFFVISLLASPFVASAAVTAVDVPRTAEFTVNQLQKFAGKAWQKAIAVILINTIQFAVDRLAYDAAVFVASGGNADAPLFENKSLPEYFQDYGARVAGEAIGELNDQIGEAGGILSNFDLCAPTSPEILLSFKLGLKGVYDRPVPDCDINKIKSNWTGFIADVQSKTSDGAVFKNKLILTQLDEMYNPKTNDFSIGLQLYSDILGKAKQDQDLAKDNLLFQGRFKDVTDVISGNIESPGHVIQENFKKAQEDPWDTKQESLWSLFGNEDLLTTIGIQAASTFSNTLISQGTKKLYDGFFKFDNVETDPFDVGALGSYSSEDARQAYRTLVSAAPLEVTNYSVLGEFAACPAESRGLYNCVVDTSFVSAVARSDAGAPLTLSESIEEGLINGDLPLIPSTDLAKNQDPYCYTYGFCYSNLVKLRKARIIPDGWELAADSTENRSGSNITLKQAMDAFYSCNTAGDRDEQFPWCHLVDPNWVLKYPEMQCRAQVHGQLLETAASDLRKDECVDMPSCIAEDDQGNCIGGYGYCTREENTWRFRGESCPDYAAACLTVTDSTGSDSNLIMNTVDFGECTAANAGCLWYDVSKQVGDDDAYAYEAHDDVAAEDADGAGTSTERIYFTGAALPCDAEDGGCAQLVERTDDLRLNLLQNSSFESDSNADNFPDGWLATSASGVTYSDDNQARNGSWAVNPGAAIIYTPGVVLSQSSFYTLTYYAKQGSSGAVTAQALVAMKDETRGQTIDLSGTSMSTDCELLSTDNSIIVLNGQPTGSDYERFSCTFTSPTLNSSTSRVTAFVDFLGGDVWVDDVQLEQGEDASNWHEAYSSADLTYVYAKVPPAYLGCDGSADEPAECDNYSQVCTENDVGCTAYSPTNGDPQITGIATALDYCPSECVGYDTYKQEPTLYEPEGEFPLYFIPDTATTCSQEFAGCDEFTNESTEALEYFTYLRACVTDTQAADQAATYYTWEGSDRDGYQLQTWSLLESNLSAAYNGDTYDGSGDAEPTPGRAPCTTWTTSTAGITCNDDADSSGHFDTDSADCDEHDDIFENPSCREFYDTDGDLHYRDWSKTVTVNAACTTYRKTEVVGTDTATQSSNCTTSGGFYDSGTGECRYFGFTDESTTCSEQENGCRLYTGGRSRNSRIVLDDNFESGTLSGWDAESAGFATLSNESLATSGHSMAITYGVATFSYNHGSTCATEAGCVGDAVALGGTCTVANGEQYCGTLHDELYAGKTYTVSFVAKGTGTLAVGFDLQSEADDPEVDVSFGTVTLTGGWQEFTLGPLDMNATDYQTFGDGTTLAFAPSNGDSAYLDNITLREGEGDIAVIKNSWVTPASCDQTPEAADSAQYYLGCAEYTTQDAETVYLKSFSSLCNEDVVGCDAYFKTQESDSAYAQTYNVECVALDGALVTTPTNCYYATTAGAYDTTSPFLCTIGVGQSACEFTADWYLAPSISSEPGHEHLRYAPSTHVVPADTDLFLVVTDATTCAESAAGCTEYGQPIWNMDKTATTGADPVYLMNTPADYASILCVEDALFCQEWQGSDGTTYEFKDPIDQTCEYRTSVTVGGVTYDGWFKTGTDSFCYSSGDTGTYIIGGTESGLWRNGDDAYAGWVGTCSQQYDSCSEFQDLLDVKAGEVYGAGDGQSYYYLNNDNLDENTLPASQQCNGQVSQEAGCSLFNNTALTSQSYNASASFVASTNADALYGREPGALVNPVDCEIGDPSITTPDGTAVNLCAQRCVYDHGELYDITDGAPSIEKFFTLPGPFTASELYVMAGSCYTSSDCADIATESGDLANGVCLTEVPLDLGGSVLETVPALENDTNTILKVNRDRECSQWLSCSDSQTVWDDRTGSYRTVCSSFGLCDEYSSNGDSSLCTSWSNDNPATVLSADLYASRDTTWYGDEYSGLAIPNLYPVEKLSQINVAPPVGKCDLTQAYRDGDVDESTYNTYQGVSCTSFTQCNGISGSCVTEEIPDYRLAYNAGSCEEAYGLACTVGYCENTGATCSDNASCGSAGGLCLAGSCATYVGSYTSTAECQAAYGLSYYSKAGQCVQDGDTVDIETYNDNLADPNGACSSGETFVTVVGFSQGTCLQDSCVLTPTGETFDVATSEQSVCRAYPENNSPFSNSVVDSWKNPDAYEDTDSHDVGDASTIPDLIPYTTVSSFENAKLCNAGEVCDCSYKKVSFGDGAATRYYNVDSSLPEHDWGICVGGAFDGSYCNSSGSNSTSDAFVISDEECQNGTSDGQYTGGGTCTYPTQIDTLLGMEGYCLERDTGMNILGDRNQNACLTWLPVDQLAGATDLYAKDTGAGYFDDTYMCTDVQPFVDLLLTEIPAEDDTSMGSGDIACAESGLTGDVIQGNAYDTDTIVEGAKLGCVKNAECPAGHWLLMGQPTYDDDNDWSYANACSGDAAFEVNDCPYTCVPMGAYTLDASGAYASCDPDGDLVAAVLESSTNSGFDFDGYQDNEGNDIYVVGRAPEDCEDNGLDAHCGEQEFVDLVNTVRNCRAIGVEYDSDFVNDVYNFDASTGIANGDTDGAGYCSTNTAETCTTDGASCDSNNGTCIIVAGAESNSTSEGYRDLIVNIDRYPACAETTQVASNEGGSIEGYAWTDRLFNPNSNFSITSSNAGLEYDYVTPPWPFGAFGAPETRFTYDPPFMVAACQSTDGERTITLPAGVTTCPSGYEAANIRNIDDRSLPTDPEARAYVDYNYLTTPSYNASDNSGRDPGAIWSVSDTSDSLNRINQVFASLSFGNQFAWNGIVSASDNLTYEEVAGGAASDSAVAAADVRGDQGNPPSVWALNMGNCTGTECEEGRLNALTINGADSGDLKAAELMQATLSFYAGADKNQLPLRRIIVDWQDGSTPTGSSADDNFYKNHRGLQNGSSTSICETNPGSSSYEWGMNSQSCDPNYLSYTHVYTCDSEIALGEACSDSPLDSDADYDNLPCQVGGSCYFRPKVHVRDNWGWCGGTCDAENGCFDGPGNMSSQDSDSQCAYEAYPEDNPTLDPWIYYDGYVVVTP